MVLHNLPAIEFGTAFLILQKSFNSLSFDRPLSNDNIVMWNISF